MSYAYDIFSTFPFPIDSKQKKIIQVSRSLHLGPDSSWLRDWKLEVLKYR